MPRGRILKEEEEEEEVDLPALVVARIEPSEEQSPSKVVARFVSELTPEEEVSVPPSDTESEPVKAGSFEFEPNKEGELPIDTPLSNLQYK